MALGTLRSSTRQNSVPLAQCGPRSALGNHENSDRLARTLGDTGRQRRNGILYPHSLEGMTSSDELEMNTFYSDIIDDEEAGLTSAERAKRKQQQRKNTRLDERVAGSASGAYDISDHQEKYARRQVIKSLVINGVLISMWYFFSISISVYNKWMFRDEKTPTEGDDENRPKPPPVFPFPLFTTCAHMMVQFTLAALVMLVLPGFRPRLDSVNLHAPRSHSEEPSDPNKPLMSKWFYISRIAPCGLATGTDIGLGNMSLKFISLTFYTMCKSSVLGFVLIFAFIFRLEKPTWRLCTIITVMTMGVVMMVAGETAFDMLGFVLVMTSAASSGFRWSLTQILLLRNPATSNPFASIFFLAPVMFFALLIIAIPVEGFFALGHGLAHLVELKGIPLTVCILAFPGCLAFMMTASEFALLQRTSVVTLSICGIFKEVVTISTASIVFEDKLTRVNISGVLVTIVCIAVYNYMKIMKMRDEARMEALVANADYQPVSTADDDSALQTANGKSRNTRGTDRRGSNGSVMRNVRYPNTATSSEGRDASGKASPAKRPEDHE